MAAVNCNDLYHTKPNAPCPNGNPHDYCRDYFECIDYIENNAGE